MPDPTFTYTEDDAHLHVTDTGLIWTHTCRDGVESTERLPIGGEHGWTVHGSLETEHLTVTPSILCTRCGTHGFITAGVWHGC